MPPKKPRIHINKLWFFVLEVLGFGLSTYLFLVSAGLVPTPPCVRNSIFACTTILRGDFSHIGPFSVAAMGMVYYVAHLMLTFGLRDRHSQLIKGLMVMGSLVFIAWLRSIELIYEHKICPWCWGVALVTLLHAGVTYTIVAPPLPRLRPAGIGGLVLGGFIVLIGLVSVVELTLGFGKLLQGQKASIAAGEETDEESKVQVAGPQKDDVKLSKPAVAKASPSPTPKPAKATPTVVPSATPGPSVVMSDVPPTPVPTPSPTPAPSATPAESDWDPEPAVADSEEVRILRKRGWRHASSGQSVVKAVKNHPPVLLLAYDPHCSDCHRLITTVLDSDVLNSLPVTRMCIQESMLSGQLNEMIKALPTLLLFDDDGSILLTNVGSRISDKELAEKVRKALVKTPPPAQ